MKSESGSFDYEAALAACARQDGEALRRLYRQESAYLLGVVQRIVRDRARSEDIVHDAFLKIWNKAATFEADKGSGRGWIYSVARNLALNAVRDGTREARLDDDAHAAIDASASLQAWSEARDAFNWRDSVGNLEPCLEQLEPIRRNCILHAYVERLSHGEIADRVGAPLGTVKAWIRRSLLALRECLQ